MSKQLSTLDKNYAPQSDFTKLQMLLMKSHM